MSAQQLKWIKDVNESLIVNMGGEALIDANLLADTIKDVVNLVDYSKREISPSTNVELKVEAFQPSSFQIAFNAIFDVLGSDISGNIASVLSFVIAAVPCIITIAKHLGGKKPKSVEQDQTSNSVTIHNHENAQLTVTQSVYNIYATPDCNSTVARIFDRLESDGTRENFKIKAKTAEEIVEAKDFDKLATATSLEPLNDNVTTQKLSKVEVVVRKPDLTGRSQWLLYFIKHISATIEDNLFLEQVHSGHHHFRANDTLIVDLRIEMIIGDNNLVQVGSERYFVEHVYKHLSYSNPLTDNQLSLDDI